MKRKKLRRYHLVVPQETHSLVHSAAVALDTDMLRLTPILLVRGMKATKRRGISVWKLLHEDRTIEPPDT